MSKRLKRRKKPAKRPNLAYDVGSEILVACLEREAWTRYSPIPGGASMKFTRP